MPICPLIQTEIKNYDQNCFLWTNETMNNNWETKNISVVFEELALHGVGWIVYLHVCMHIYTWIYINREREGSVYHLPDLNFWWTKSTSLVSCEIAYDMVLYFLCELAC